MGATPERAPGPASAPARDEDPTPAPARDEGPTPAPARDEGPTPALARVDGLLDAAARRPLSDDECRRLVDELASVPGRVRAAVDALARQSSAAAVDELRRLPPASPGVLEALHRAITRGVRRPFASGRTAPPLLALDFRNSRARDFPRLLVRASSIFGENLETLRAAGQLHFRAMLLATPRLPEFARTRGADLAYLYRRLARLRGTRLWLDGWCFTESDGLSAAGRSHLLQAWIDRARRSPR